MASIIIADENEGRRNLLANTFEREGYEVTRLSTLAQTTATASAVLPCSCWKVNGAKGASLMCASLWLANLAFVRLHASLSSPEPQHLIFFHRLPWQAWLRSLENRLT